MNNTDCAECGSTEIETVVEIDTNFYLKNHKPCFVPLRKCKRCGFKYFDDFLGEIASKIIIANEKEKPEPTEPNIEDADICVDLSGGRLLIEKFRQRIGQLKAKNERLKKQFHIYADHLPTCQGIVDGFTSHCSCGLEQALEDK